MCDYMGLGWMWEKRCTWLERWWWEEVMAMGGGVVWLDYIGGVV